MSSVIRCDVSIFNVNDQHDRHAEKTIDVFVRPQFVPVLSIKCDSNLEHMLIEEYVFVTKNNFILRK